MKKKMLKHAAVFGTIVAAAVFSTGAQAATQFSGTITAGHPVTYSLGGATERLAPCDSSSDLNGVDGVWFEVTGLEGQEALLETDSTLDGDVWFYTADCDFIDNDEMALGGLGDLEIGSIPADAAFAIVDGFVGTGNFIMTVGV